MYSLYITLPVDFRGFTFLSLLIRITLKGYKSHVLQRSTLSYTRLLIDYVTNRTYIFKASKRRLIQINYLFQAKKEYLYGLAVKYEFTVTDYYIHSTR